MSDGIDLTPTPDHYEAMARCLANSTLGDIPNPERQRPARHVLDGLIEVVAYLAQLPDGKARIARLQAFVAPPDQPVEAPEPLPRRVFTQETEWEEFRVGEYIDYCAYVNYKSAGDAVRATLTHNTESDTWWLVIEQEEGAGSWHDVIGVGVSHERAAEMLTW